MPATEPLILPERLPTPLVPSRATARARATSSSYSLTAQAADNGAKFSVKGCADNQCQTSQSATLTVIARSGAAANTVSVLAGQPDALGNPIGSSAAAQFSIPTGSAVDAAGNVYVADSLNNSIRKVSPAGVVTVLAGSNSANLSGSTDGAGVSALFSMPTGIVIDAAGNLYVTDSGNSTIRKIRELYT